MSETIDVKITVQCNSTPQSFYDTWLSEGKIRAWMSPALQSMGCSGELVQIKADAQVGGKFLFSDMREGTEYKHWGEYTALERGKKVVYTWNHDAVADDDPGKVDIDIAATDSGCEVTVVNTMDAKFQEFEEQCKSGWQFLIEAADKVASS